ncbi:hypothetical protein QJQ45_006872 [Haematococcus lacustris]|nr:hypothetical protein QJQ45_006872 [Haematococcus lacustris]
MPIAGPSTSPGKQREERRAEWKTQRRQVIKAPGGAVLRGCKKTKRKLMAHFQLRAGVHSQLRVIASLYVLRIFLTCLVGYCTPGYPSAPTPPAVQPPLASDAAPLPPLPLRVPAQPAAMDMDWAPEAEAEASNSSISCNKPVSSSLITLSGLVTQDVQHPGSTARSPILETADAPGMALGDRADVPSDAAATGPRMPAFSAVTDVPEPPSSAQRATSANAKGES